MSSKPLESARFNEQQPAVFLEVNLSKFSTSNVPDSVTGPWEGVGPEQAAL